ncbi:FtsX-like permease family protein [Nonomuraea phyllanthi]|nr:FtsX-like permease family protein [Nonomuraea phyllanthi]QFY10938.1 FtsX-like permease family protein [Nonomuraea phyllanthi]
MRIWRLAREHLGTVAVLSVLALSACALVAGLPRAMQASYDEALRRALTAAPAVLADLTVTAESRSREDDLRERAQFGSRDRLWHEIVPARLRPLVASGGHMSAKTYRTPITGTSGQAYINLGWLSDAGRRVDWVRGRAPGAPATMRYEGRTIPVFEVGIVEEALAEMDLRLGQTKIVGESDYAAVRIAGVFRAKDPADRSWGHNADILHVQRLEPLQKHITALIPDAGLSVLSGEGRNLTYRWVLPVNARAARAAAVPDLQAAVADFDRAVALRSTGAPGPYHVQTGLPKLLGDFQAELSTARTVMSLVLAGLLAVALGVIVLAVGLLAGRLDHTLTLARARGGSLRQVAGTAAALTGLAVAPGAAVGYALSYLVPGPVPPIVHAGPAIVVLVSVGFAAVRLAFAHRLPLRERRDDVAAARPSARRITLEALVVVLALAATYLLRARGLGASTGPDPFLLVVPVALTAAVAVITLRCCAYPLRLLARLAARGRAAVPFLGLTRAARARSGSVLPVLVLLPALGVSVFAAVVSDGISGTQWLASWQQVGAPIKVTSDIEIPAAEIERVRALPGVEQVVPAQTGEVQVGYGGEWAGAIAVDVNRWRRVLADAPVGLPALSGGALVSPELRGRGTFEIGWQSRLTLATRGVIASVPGFYTEGKFLVVPIGVQLRPAVNTLLIKGDASLAELARLVPSATVTSQEAALAAIRDDPLTSAVRWALVVVTAALAAYALAAVVLSLVAGAAERARAVSFLRTLGLSERQARRLTVLEILPLILVTGLVGLGLGLLLPVALGPAVDLSPYAGDLPVGDYPLDLFLPSALAAGLAGVAVLGAYAHTVVNRRRGLGAVLRVGDLA